MVGNLEVEEFAAAILSIALYCDNTTEMALLKSTVSFFVFVS
jgi:hypothetical protein